MLVQSISMLFLLFNHTQVPKNEWAIFLQTIREREKLLVMNNGHNNEQPYLRNNPLYNFVDELQYKDHQTTNFPFQKLLFDFTTVWEFSWSCFGC